MKVALITGSNRGIGLETCRLLGTRGFHVILTARKEADREQISEYIPGYFCLKDKEYVFHPTCLMCQMKRLLWL